MEKVGQWDRFEISVANARQYDDPYGEVSLDVTCVRPDGSRADSQGFYDGGDTWRVRLMPDRIGDWRCEAVFSDGSPGVGGAFRCVPSDIPGVLWKDEANPIWFGFRGGRHAMVRCLHVGDRFFASNWPDDRRKAFLDWLVGQGYNMLSVASHYLKRNEPDRGGEWDTPGLWPLDAAAYRRMERILDDLAARHVMVYPFAGFFGKNSNYPRDQADQERYIRYTLARLGAYWNLLFNVAGPEPNLRRTWMEAEDVERLGRTILKTDMAGHALSVHNRTGDDPYRDSAWTSYGILQGPKTTDRAVLSEGLLRNHSPDKPLLAQETLWSNNKNHPLYTDVDIRKNAYVIHMSATALCFGDMDGNSSTGFSDSMDLSERVQKRHDIVRMVWDFFEGIPFYRMAPCQDLVDNGYCLAEVGREYLVYLESPGTVNVSVAGGPYEVRWINAQDTSDRRPGGTTPDGRGLASPEGGEDWLVHLVHT